jgi:hypothetical protein
MKPNQKNVPIDKKIWKRIRRVAKREGRFGNSMAEIMLKRVLPEFETQPNQGMSKAELALFRASHGLPEPHPMDATA